MLYLVCWIGLLLNETTEFVGDIRHHYANSPSLQGTVETILLLTLQVVDWSIHNIVCTVYCSNKVDGGAEVMQLQSSLFIA